MKIDTMKSKTKPAKLKRYYLKPGPVQIDAKTFGSKWYLCTSNDERPHLWDETKDKCIKRASYIRSHGGGTLRIMLRNGKFQEGRTYPKGSDPRRSKG